MKSPHLHGIWIKGNITHLQVLKFPCNFFLDGFWYQKNTLEISPAKKNTSEIKCNRNYHVAFFRMRQPDVFIKEERLKMF